MRPLPPFQLLVMLTAALVALAAPGCMVPLPARLPAPTRLVTEPATGGQYYLYVPSSYRADRAYPLVVTCHGTPPWDTAKFQIDEWSPVAETKEFIVIAPELVGTRGDILPPADEQLERQRKDEALILAAVQHVRAAHNVALDQVFITGWSAGSFAVMHTGLKHPEIFRAVAIRQGNFDLSYVAPLRPYLDPYQPIHVLYGSLDVIVAGQVEPMLDWLRENHMFVHEEEVYGAHQRHPDKVYEFFRRCVRNYAWLRIEAFEHTGDDPLSVRLRLVGSPAPNKFKWDFGDKQTSTEASPYHVYAAPGTYQVRVVARIGRKTTERRMVQIEVPRRGLPTPAPIQPLVSRPN